MITQINAATRLLAAVTSGTIEKAIKKKFGIDAKLYKGKGYYYFADPDEGKLMITGWPEVAVYVTRLNQLSLDRWLDEFERLMNQGDRGLQDRLNEERYGKKKK